MGNVVTVRDVREVDGEGDVRGVWSVGDASGVDGERDRGGAGDGESVRDVQGVRYVRGASEGESARDGEGAGHGEGKVVSVRDVERVRERLESVRRGLSLRDGLNLRDAESVKHGLNLRDAENVRYGLSLRNGIDSRDAESLRHGLNLRDAESLRHGLNLRDAESLRHSLSLRDAESVRRGLSLRDGIDSRDAEGARRESMVKSAERARRGSNVRDAINFRRASSARRASQVRDGANNLRDVFSVRDLKSARRGSNVRDGVNNARHGVDFKEGVDVRGGVNNGELDRLERVSDLQAVLSLLLRMVVYAVSVLLLSKDDAAIGEPRGGGCGPGEEGEGGEGSPPLSTSSSASSWVKGVENGGGSSIAEGAGPSPLQGPSARPPGPNGGPLPQGPAAGAAPRQGPAAAPAAEGESLQFEEISAAAFMIQNAVQRTPCMYSRLSKYYGSEIFVKKEFLHVTGSAKERGVRYCLQMMSKDQRARGVVAVGACSSAHALAVSHHAAEMRVPARVLVAARAPEALLRACRDLGANAARVPVVGGSSSSSGGGGEGVRGARAHALQVAREEGSALLEDDDHPNMIAGMGTLGLEVMEQVPGVEAVVIPAGGRGSLLAGAAAAIKHLDPHVAVVGVELASCPSWQRALTMGQPTPSCSGDENRLCEDLSSQSVGPNAFATGRHVIDKVVSITEQDLLLAMLKVLEFEGAAVNADGAAALAAIVSGKLPELRGKRVVVVLASGSTDVSHFKRCVDRALVLDGRLCKFSVRVSDSPAEPGRLLELLGREEARLVDISLDRTFLATDSFSVQVTCVVETRDHVHAAQLKGVLAEKYAALTWHDK
ncbi:uncharacterized protein LOC133350483 [Lethenteron reissneri]|uniref:uncharacterized protein LOC133350483 n=1 Tax=Lethenteron reissneri TaxID=7753 RepID=UPI002AB7537C|nr:uncharacterized protein LOC133350483 [Lethenteron reissneri]